MTTNSTSIAPKKSCCEVSAATSTAVRGSRISRRKPSEASPKTELSSSSGTTSGSKRVSGNTIHADASMVRENSAIAVPAPLTASSSDAVSGPATTPALSIQPIAAFPAVSSSGVCTATGSSTFIVGRVRL